MVIPTTINGQQLVNTTLKRSLTKQAEEYLNIHGNDHFCIEMLSFQRIFTKCSL